VESTSLPHRSLVESKGAEAARPLGEKTISIVLKSVFEALVGTKRQVAQHLICGKALELIIIEISRQLRLASASFQIVHLFAMHRWF
jgi:hypothetical protein